MGVKLVSMRPILLTPNLVVLHLPVESTAAFFPVAEGRIRPIVDTRKCHITWPQPTSVQTLASAPSGPEQIAELTKSGGLFLSGI